MKNAARYGADPTRVVLAGESAGANLATSLAVALAYEREEPFARAAYETGVIPKAVVPACGVFQVTDIARLKRRKPGMSTFIADRLGEVESAYLGGVPPSCSRDLADPLVVFERGERADASHPAVLLAGGDARPAPRRHASPRRRATQAWACRRSTRTTRASSTRSTRS